METLKIGMREFRENLAGYLESDKPLRKDTYTILANDRFREVRDRVLENICTFC
jgi:hypothetical protein